MPKEYPKLENPFDLQTEGVTLTKEQLNQAKHFEDARHEKLKVDMDAMINKLSKSNRTSQMNDFLDHDQNSKCNKCPSKICQMVALSTVDLDELNHVKTGSKLFSNCNYLVFVSPPASTRSLVSVSALETREWKMTDAF